MRIPSYIAMSTPIFGITIRPSSITGSLAYVSVGRGDRLRRLQRRASSWWWWWSCWWSTSWWWWSSTSTSTWSWCSWSSWRRVVVVVLVVVVDVDGVAAVVVPPAPCRRRSMPPHAVSSSAAANERCRDDGASTSARIATRPSRVPNIVHHHVISIIDRCAVDRLTGGALAVGDAGRDADPAVARAGEHGSRSGRPASTLAHTLDVVRPVLRETPPRQRVIESAVGCRSIAEMAADLGDHGVGRRRRRRGARPAVRRGPARRAGSGSPSGWLPVRPLLRNRTTRRSRSAAATWATR